MDSSVEMFFLFYHTKINFRVIDLTLSICECMGWGCLRKLKNWGQKKYLRLWGAQVQQHFRAVLRGTDNGDTMGTHKDDVGFPWAPVQESSWASLTCRVMLLKSLDFPSGLCRTAEGLHWAHTETLMCLRFSLCKWQSRGSVKAGKGMLEQLQAEITFLFLPSCRTGGLGLLHFYNRCTTIRAALQNQNQQIKYLPLRRGMSEEKVQEITSGLGLLVWLWFITLKE